MKQTSLHALQGEDWQVSGNDDGDGIEDGALHFVSGLTDALHRCFVGVTAVAHVPDVVIHNASPAVHTPSAILHAKIMQTYMTDRQLYTVYSKHLRIRPYT